MQHENLLIEFITNAVESILALNDKKTLSKKDNLGFESVSNSAFNIGEKIRSNWSKARNKEFFVEFVLIDIVCTKKFSFNFYSPKNTRIILLQPINMMVQDYTL